MKSEELRMKNFAFCTLVFSFLVTSLWAQSGSEKFLHKTERASQLIELLDSSDDDIKDASFKELLIMGKDALPFIEDKLRRRGGGLYLELLKSIYTEGLIPDDKAENVRVDLPTKVSKRDVDRYVYTKYVEAVMLFNKHDYERAGEIVGALMTLEPNSTYKGYLGKIDEVCRQKRWQDSLVAASITSDNELYDISQTPKITFRLKNVSDKKVTIVSAGKKGRGYILVHTKTSFYDPLGTATTFEGDDTVELEPELDLEAGKKWEKVYAIPTLRNAIGNNFIAVYEISAKILPQEIMVDSGKCFKQINFDGAVCRVYPTGSKEIVKEGALKMLGKAVDGGTIKDIFVCSMLLSEGEKDAGLEILMRALSSVASPSPAEAMILTSVKQLTGLPYGQDKNAWLGWWNGKDKR